MRSKSVVILYKYIPRYRLPFFIEIQQLCERNEIDLKVIYGNPGKDDLSKGNAVSFQPGIYKENRFITVGNTELTWQPVLSEIRRADLVIVEQASKLIVNYLLIGRQFLRVQKLAFWGHGRNFQAVGSGGIREKFKKMMVPLPHWWFAYTSGTAKYVAEAGFPSERITVVQNSTDTKAIRDLRSHLSTSDIDAARRILGMSQNVCIYIGSMYPEKRIRFLLSSCSRIRELVPNFQMIFAGAGPDAVLIKEFCASNSWAIYVGPVFGADMVKFASLARLLLMPGLVGLAILDSFALSIPIITTDIGWHSPEIEYLENGVNGIIVSPADNVELYASTVADLLCDEDQRAKLIGNCHAAASIYTIRGMAERFFDGMKKALL